MHARALLILAIGSTRRALARCARQGALHGHICKHSGQSLKEQVMTTVLADALVPIFAGILLGYCAGLWRRMDNQNVQTLITFVMSFAVPAALFLSIAQTPRAELREQAGAALVLTIVYAVLYAFTFFWARSGQ